MNINDILKQTGFLKKLLTNKSIYVRCADLIIIKNLKYLDAL